MARVEIEGGAVDRTRLIVARLKLAQLSEHGERTWIIHSLREREQKVFRLDSVSRVQRGGGTIQGSAGRPFVQV